MIDVNISKIYGRNANENIDNILSRNRLLGLNRTEGGFNLVDDIGFGYEYAKLEHDILEFMYPSSRECSKRYLKIPGYVDITYIYNLISKGGFEIRCEDTKESVSISLVGTKIKDSLNIKCNSNIMINSSNYLENAISIERIEKDRCIIVSALIDEGENIRVDDIYKVIPSFKYVIYPYKSEYRRLIKNILDYYKQPSIALSSAIVIKCSSDNFQIREGEYATSFCALEGFTEVINSEPIKELLKQLAMNEDIKIFKGIR